MKRIIAKPEEVKLTFIRHPDHPRRQKSFECLNNLLSKSNLTEAVPAITVVDDNGEFLAYDGNVRVEHAKKHGYSLMADVISNQDDLVSYVSVYEPKFFNIRNFQDLIEIMRIYTKQPVYDQQFSKEDLEKVFKMKNKYHPSLYDDMDLFSGHYTLKKEH